MHEIVFVINMFSEVTGNNKWLSNDGNYSQNENT